MNEYIVRLIYLSGTVKDVLKTRSKDEAEQFIKDSKLRRPRIRHQLGTRRVRTEDYGFVCTHKNGGLQRWQPN